MSGSYNAQSVPESPSMGHTTLLLHTSFPIAPSHATTITHLHLRSIPSRAADTVLLAVGCPAPIIYTFKPAIVYVYQVF
ncbi:hypothetical protein M422DRAFT_31479 [Sphaerobolus stellatus SS14]|uniref:Uncharacterized protein n=1 Tax=Sphaerobolus stellatus (strain SS14) TaxID=990650 RepID=A0A0C9V5B6_SPHS4|nr:hypothetical protein M422DRAFT_31479 [Sphaerobolus stellatus SS14]